MELESYIFDFDKSPTFMRKWNKEFDVEVMGETCFKIVLIDDICDDNIGDCLNSEGKISYSEEHLLILNCSLAYDDNGDTSYVTLDGNVSVAFPYTDNYHSAIDSFNMKGVFITTESGYVMGYSINQYSTPITNEFIMEDGLRLWTIREGVNSGE